MKIRYLLAAAAAAAMLAMTGCGMKEEDAVKAVQEKLDAAAAAQTGQELQDLILEGAPGSLTGFSADENGEILSGIASHMSFTSSGAEKTEDGFRVTVDAVPVSIEILPGEYMETYKDICGRAREQGLSPEDLKGEAFGQMAADAFLALAGQKACEGQGEQYSVDITAKGETDENALSDIIRSGAAVTWPDIAEETLTETACVILYDLPGTYLGTADLTENVASEVDKAFGVESEGQIFMDMYLELKEDYTMDFRVDTARFVQSTREYYDKNLDRWFASQGGSVDALVRSGQFGSRDEILDYLIKSAGYDEESGSLPAIDSSSFSGTWYFEDGAVMITDKTDRFERQEDGSLVSFIEDMEISFVKQ